MPTFCSVKSRVPCVRIRTTSHNMQYQRDFFAFPQPNDKDRSVWSKVSELWRASATSWSHQGHADRHRQEENIGPAELQYLFSRRGHVTKNAAENLGGIRVSTETESTQTRYNTAGAYRHKANNGSGAARQRQPPSSRRGAVYDPQQKRPERDKPTKRNRVVRPLAAPSPRLSRCCS